MRAALVIIGALSLAGCSTPAPVVQTKLVEVPSSKPYRYITFSEGDDPDTILQIKRHNRAHSAVISAEKRR